MKRFAALLVLTISFVIFTGCQSKDEVALVEPAPVASESCLEFPIVAGISEIPGSIVIPEISEVPETSSDTDEFTPVFFSSAIDDVIFDRINGLSYKEGCGIALSDLRYLSLSYVGFDGEPHQGELICNASVADDLLEIFQELFENGYEIESLILVDEFGADDDASMEANNSSCFNYRTIKNSSKLSNHSFGMAIDINPLYNPYIKKADGTTKVEPSTAIDYIDRNEDFPHKIDENDLAYKLFTQHGFSWGGSWSTSKDYQHFEKK